MPSNPLPTLTPLPSLSYLTAGGTERVPPAHWKVGIYAHPDLICPSVNLESRPVLPCSHSGLTLVSGGPKTEGMRLEFSEGSEGMRLEFFPPPSIPFSFS